MIEKNDIINLNNQITKFDSDMGTLACNINEESQYIDDLNQSKNVWNNNIFKNKECDQQ